MILASERGAFYWLTTLLLAEHGFTLHKSALQDALALRYGWLLRNVPVKCDCGKPFSVEHIGVNGTHFGVTVTIFNLLSHCPEK